MNNQRRKTLRTLLTATGAGMIPLQWKTPRIESILLPAHAGTTMEEPCFDLRLTWTTPDGSGFLDLGNLNQANGVGDPDSMESTATGEILTWNCGTVDFSSGNRFLSFANISDPENTMTILVETQSNSDSVMADTGICNTADFDSSANVTITGGC